MTSYDAILFLSFGGPEGMDDVMPFLENVLRGKNVPQARMLEVASHYQRFEGVSPINGQNRGLIEGLKQELEMRSIKLPVYWGNRNWHPLLADTLRQMKADGIKRALVFITSAYSSYSGCRQYREDIEKAQIEAAAGDIQFDKLRVFYNHPLFVEANIEAVKAGLAQFSQVDQKDLHVAFTAHSIPMAMANNCDYVKQLTETCELTAKALSITNFKLVYQSRSGPPSQPWLEPDVLDYMRELHGAGIRQILLHPIGFISDHMEIVYDLDHEAKELGRELEIQFVRTSTVGTNPKFARMMADLVEERLESNNVADATGATVTTKRKAIGCFGPAPDVCAPDCCSYTPTRPAHASAQRPQST